MQDNRYEPPQAEVAEPSADGMPATSSSATTGWFTKRPIPVFVIAGLCILQFAGISLFVAEHWSEVIELVRVGHESPIAFVAKFLYPLLLLVAGVLLLFMRKAATYAFSLYLAWGLTQVFSRNIDFKGYLDLALVLGVVVYCLRLQKAGRLK